MRHYTLKESKRRTGGPKRSRVRLGYMPFIYFVVLIVLAAVLGVMINEAFYDIEDGQPRARNAATNSSFASTQRPLPAAHDLRGRGK